MPYINETRRAGLDPAIDTAIQRCPHQDNGFARRAIGHIVCRCWNIGGVPTFPEIEAVVSALRRIDWVKGDVNYTLTRLTLGLLRPPNGWGYTSLSSCVGVVHDVYESLAVYPEEARYVLRDVEFEIRRRLLDPYEDEAIQRNGDVPEIEIEWFRQGAATE